MGEETAIRRRALREQLGAESVAYLLHELERQMTLTMYHLAQNRQVTPFGREVIREQIVEAILSLAIPTDAITDRVATRLTPRR
jgi:hypothetical protein